MVLLTLANVPIILWKSETRSLPASPRTRTVNYAGAANRDILPIALEHQPAGGCRVANTCHPCEQGQFCNRGRQGVPHLLRLTSEDGLPAAMLGVVPLSRRYRLLAAPQGPWIEHNSS